MPTSQTLKTGSAPVVLRCWRHGFCWNFVTGEHLLLLQSGCMGYSGLLALL